MSETHNYNEPVFQRSVTEVAYLGSG